MKKRIISILTMLCLAASLTACGSKEPTDTITSVEDTDLRNNGEPADVLLKDDMQEPETETKTYPPIDPAKYGVPDDAFTRTDSKGNVYYYYILDKEHTDMIMEIYKEVRTKEYGEEYPDVTITVNEELCNILQDSKYLEQSESQGEYYLNSEEIGATAQEYMGENYRMKKFQIAGDGDDITKKLIDKEAMTEYIYNTHQGQGIFDAVSSFSDRNHEIALVCSVWLFPAIEGNEKEDYIILGSFIQKETE